MLTCKETSSAIAGDELSTAGWRRRWQVRLHLLMCRHCRAYAAQIKALGQAARDLLGRPDLDPAALDRMERQILEQLDETAPQSVPPAAETDDSQDPDSQDPV